ncbi:FadR/GntR family transcriptional regulator [Peterkaempfera bronchialis]|nr:FadR/GntR family transcriptional regulator [Peterkaempfera bronchialis]
MVAAQLRRQIVTGELGEGTALPSESVLMEEFGVSRPTLREAFRVLESEGIIEVRRGARGGAHVMIPDATAIGRHTGTLLQYRGTTLADLYEARSLLEGSSVDLLVRRRTDADLAALDEALRRSETQLTSPVEWVEQHDLAFHRLVMERTGNQTLTALLESLFTVVELHNRSFMLTHPVGEDAQTQVRESHSAHVKLVALIRAGEAERAARHWRRHLELVGDYLIEDPSEVVLDVLS